MAKTGKTLGVAALIGALAVLAACGGPSEAPSAPSSPAEPPAVVEPGGSSSFEGLPVGEAAALAEAEGRPWRVGREDGEAYALTQDYVVGRVTFEIDDGIVTRAVIEG